MVCAQCATGQDAAAMEADAAGMIRSCARCGALLPLRGAYLAGNVVDATAERGPVDAALPLTAEALGATAHISHTPGTDLMLARPSLPALLWRQPAVRAAARAGAGAVALTLGMRVLRIWLARPRQAGQVANAAVPLVRELFDQPAAGRQWRGRAGRRVRNGAHDGAHDGDVVETFIYVRRVLRQR